MAKQPGIDTCPRCGKAKRADRQLCGTCNSNLKRLPDVVAVYCHEGRHRTPVPEATMRKIAILRGEEVEPEPEPVAVVVEEEEEFDPFKERVKVETKPPVTCLCGSKLDSYGRCRCGRKG